MFVKLNKLKINNNSEMLNYKINSLYSHEIQIEFKYIEISSHIDTNKVNRRHV